MNDEWYAPLMPYVVLVVVAIGLGIAAVYGFARALRWRVTGTGRRSGDIALASAFATAVLVFVLTYLSAWVGLRQTVILGDDIMSMRLDSSFRAIRQELSDFKRVHGHYPDSFEEVESSMDWQPRDPWGHPYQYTKTGTGYQLLTLGRDGKPGGIGLDADIDSDSRVRIHAEPTLYEFLFEGRGSGTLSAVAFVASLSAGLACFLLNQPQQSRPLATRRMLRSATWTMVIALGVAIFLVAVSGFTNHH